MILITDLYLSIHIHKKSTEHSDFYEPTLKQPLTNLEREQRPFCDLHFKIFYQRFAFIGVGAVGLIYIALLGSQYLFTQATGSRLQLPLKKAWLKGPWRRFNKFILSAPALKRLASGSLAPALGTWEPFLRDFNRLPLNQV